MPAAGKDAGKPLIFWVDRQCDAAVGAAAFFFLCNSR
jgi:hypothetical protein